MDKNFNELLLSELRMATFRPGKTKNITDEILTKAMTVNENLRSYGYILRPKDMIALAASEDLDTFFDDLRSLIPEVKADPMYPDFPSQVMEMSEARLRSHQMMHYFSTYDTELLTGCQVTKGWMPFVKTTNKSKYDKLFMSTDVLELIPEKDAYVTALRIIFGRRERPGIPSEKIILEAVKHVTSEELKSVTFTFKENLLYVFGLIVKGTDRDVCIRILSNICAHSGDVLKCIQVYLKNRKYHLRTSEKRTLVKLLECYREKDFRENLMRSDKQREKNLVILRHLDFNKYAVSAAHKEAVRALRNSELISWEGQVEALLLKEDPAVLSFVGKRPGMLLRKLNRLIDMGYSEEELSAAICAHARKLSPHTLIQTIKIFSIDRAVIDRKYKEDLENIKSSLKRECDRAVSHCSWQYYVERGKCSLDSLKKDKIREILSVKTMLGISDVRRKRNDTLRILSEKQDFLRRMEESKASKHFRFNSRSSGPDWRGIYAWIIAGDPEQYDVHKKKMQEQTECLKQEAECLETTLAELLEEFQVKKEEIENDFPNKLREAGKRLILLKEEEKEEIERIKTEYTKKMNDPETFREEIAKLDHEREKSLKHLKNATVIKRILSEALRVHFSSVHTSFKEKKVFMNLKAFDLAHSELELKEKSQEGGYIRSGIAYKIPDEARYVRFFAYWNDMDRVDVDLHAFGYTTDGEELDIGWDGDYCESGVVYSGDITHSNAAEYIDIDLSAPVKVIYANVNLYHGKSGFDEIGECFTGLMAVHDAGAEVKHYNPANCFFTHTINQHTQTLYYGYIDVQNRYVRFVGSRGEADKYTNGPDINPECKFSLEEYLNIILDAQGVQLVESKEDAEVIITMGKAMEDREVSLADNNFFLEF